MHAGFSFAICKFPLEPRDVNDNSGNVIKISTFFMGGSWIHKAGVCGRSKLNEGFQFIFKQSMYVDHKYVIYRQWRSQN
jgi:hypothetical protein